MVSLNILNNTDDVEAFKEKFCEYSNLEVPLGYLFKGICYAFIHKGEVVGGFCLVHDVLYKLRSIQQIPPDAAPPFKEAGIGNINTVELIGYFLKEKSHSLYFTWNLVKTIMDHKATWFVYSYPTSQIKLEGYLAPGEPIRLYTGAPLKLTRQDNTEDVNVEALTKKGIAKIFLKRSRKEMSKT